MTGEKPDGSVGPAGAAGLEQQARYFSEAAAIHSDLPASYSYWSRHYVDDHLERLFGARDAVGFYARCILERWREHERPPVVRIASLGCGEADTEISLCKLLVAQGLNNVSFACTDIAPGAIGRAAEAARREGVSPFFRFDVGPFEGVIGGESFEVVIANQVLHHAAELERLFDLIRASIGSSGVFLSVDMIGRNGHMLWPEALAIVDRLWAMLPREQRYNHLFKRHEDLYSNWDNSKEANEGIRAQDVLPELLRRFHFQKFFAVGNLGVALFGRHFGENFDPDKDADRELIDRVGRLDHDLIDIGYLKPVLMFAAMTAEGAAPTQTYRHWTPEFCLRRAADHPAFAHLVACLPGDEITFRERSPTIELLRAGWSSPEPGGVWSNAPFSEVVIPLARPAGGETLRLQIGGRAYLSASRPTQTISVVVNGTRLGAMSFAASDGFKTHSFEVPSTLPGSSAHLSLRLEYSDTRTPLELGDSNDARRLGFFLSSLRLGPDGHKRGGGLSDIAQLLRKIRDRVL